MCYQPDEYPSAFLNTRVPPQLVGFDIEMAHRFARRRDLALAFLPSANETEAAKNLNSGRCDIYTRTMPLSAGRSQQFALTVPLYESPLGLIVEDYRRDEFERWEQLRERGSDLKLAIEAATDTLGMIRDILPETRVIPIADMSQQVQILRSDDRDVDAIVDMAEEAAAHTLFYSKYTVVVPKPAVRVPVVYAVAHGNQDLLQAINAWLLSERAKGTVDTLYEHWMLGGAIEKDRPPTWSIIRNVLGWVE